MSVKLILTRLKWVFQNFSSLFSFWAHERVEYSYDLSKYWRSSLAERNEFLSSTFATIVFTSLILHSVISFTCDTRLSATWGCQCSLSVSRKLASAFYIGQYAWFFIGLGLHIHRIIFTSFRLNELMFSNVITGDITGLMHAHICQHHHSSVLDYRLL